MYGHNSKPMFKLLKHVSILFNDVVPTSETLLLSYILRVSVAFACVAFSTVREHKVPILPTPTPFTFSSGLQPFLNTLTH
jgi:hypothetical protein